MHQYIAQCTVHTLSDHIIVDNLWPLVINSCVQIIFMIEGIHCLLRLKKGIYRTDFFFKIDIH